MNFILPEKPCLEFLKKQAKRLKKNLELNDPDALNRYNSIFDKKLMQPKLSDAQFVLANEYGFESWSKLKETILSKSQFRLATRKLSQDSQKGFLAYFKVNTPSTPLPIYMDRLKKELKVIESKKACEYFLVVADYVQWAKSNDIAVGPGRGSGPCSLVAFTLGITKVDPVKYNLPFERFLNPDRDWFPDFDLDFCDKRRGEVLAYIQSKYGFDRVAQISSDKSTPLPSRLIIGDRPLEKLVPLQVNAKKTFPVTNLTVKQVSEAGLAKFNVINQKALSLIQDRTNALAEHGIIIDINKIPLNDDKTFSLLSSGHTSNVTYLDSDNYKRTITTVKPRHFKELCAVIALSQPFMKNIIPLYIKCKDSNNSESCIHSSVTSITKETYGLAIYQEQVIQVIHKIAGLSYAQADIIRRTLKKNVDQKAIDSFKNIFMHASVGLGISKTEYENIFRHITEVSKNSFNKSHAIAFAMMAYQEAWLAKNYP